jgi:sphingolipid 4-desaturase/C4-monooxygenase
MSVTPAGALDYIRVTGDEPHALRGRKILAAHPELRTLAGPDPMSAFWIVALVTAQMAIAVAVSGTAWYVWLPLAFVVGASIDHALWVLIHECAHNLVFTNRMLNRVMAMTANIPLVVPAAMSFCKYHLLHHRHMGELALDADLSGPGEAGMVGRSSLLKTLWLAGMALVLGVVRPSRIAKIPVVERWSVTNLATQAVAMGFTIWLFGWQPVVYLTVSTVLAVGLHPLGARWIQEHFVFHEAQETYSYYGPLNRIAFNVGYHNEHHDLVTIPWRHLPTIRRTAHEYYDDLFAHQSWTRLLIAFITRRDTTLYSRIVRG